MGDVGLRYRGQRVLVTGGLGFIGSNLARRLAEEGAAVTIVDSMLPEFGANRANIEPYEDRLEVHLSDLRDTGALAALVQDQDVIFHLAGQVSHGDSMRDPQLDLAVNCVATINLVEAARHHNPSARLVYTSTRQVYGAPARVPVTEDHPTLPIDVNGINKLAAEYYHLLYDRTYGLRSVVLRLTNTYGPRQQIRSNRQGFVGIFVRQALRGETIRVYGTGEQVRDCNYVDDVVEALLLAAATDGCFGRVFNLGAPERHRLLDFVEVLDRLVGVRHELVPFPDDTRIIDIGDYYGDWSRFRTATGWQPRVDLEQGMRRTIAFYRDNAGAYWA